MASETSVAASGKVGVVRRDPMAMLPFCGYNMGEYFNKWIELGKQLGDKAPKIFNVNWFRQDDNGNFLWPGFGENIRVLDWILKRCENKINAIETPIGYIPYTKDINSDDLDIKKDTLEYILGVDKELWRQETLRIEEFYKMFKGIMPIELNQELEQLKSRLQIN